MARNQADTGRSSFSAVGLLAPVFSLLASTLSATGCVTSQPAANPPPQISASAPEVAEGVLQPRPVALASYRSAESEEPPGAVDETLEAIEPDRGHESLAELEAQAQASNPTLHRLRQDASAAQARAHYVGELPDPTIAANFFGDPIETAAGSQRANLTVMQMLPWLKRLDAQTQQACLEALALEQAYEAERLRVIGDIRTTWYRLYVTGKQIETTRANQQILQSLLDSAVATIATGGGSASDVRLGTVEYSRLEEQALTLTQQLASLKSELNRLIGRDAEYPIDVPQQLEVDFPDWSHAMLRQLAWENQPAIAAAHIRTEATRWGIEVARLQRRPNVAFNASWFAIDDNRPAPSVVDVGSDAWSVGAQFSVPLWHHKYDAIEREATWKHAASHASVEEAMRKYDSLLRDLWEQAKTANETSRLYQETILPDARQTLAVDTESYVNGDVGFDRLVRDFRSVVTLELGDHRAVGQLASALARIQQAIGIELVAADH